MLLLALALSLALACGDAQQPEEALELDLSGLDSGLEKVPLSAVGPRAPEASIGVEVEPLGSAAPETERAAEERSGATVGSGESQSASSQATDPVVDGPALAATTIATTVYGSADINSKKLGYIRLGGVVSRAAEPTRGRGCKGAWFQVEPAGYVCTDEATTDLSHPLVRAAAVRPNLDRPLPYRYGFVRATAPQYLRVPTKAEQLKSEFKLEEHLAWYAEHYQDVQRVPLGANDIPLLASGFAGLGQPHPPGFRLSTQLSTTELLGGRSPRGEIPFWLIGGRQIPNVSAFKVPEYAVFADRVRRKTGLSFVDAFVADLDGLERRFGVTVDLRLIPATKVKPDTGSPFHGVELAPGLPLPSAFVIKRSAKSWQLVKGQDEVREGSPLPRRALLPLSGAVRFKAGRRFYQAARDRTTWFQQSDVGVISLPPSWPADAEAGKRWIDVSLKQQVLVLYEGKTPRYATLVSTGRDRLGDPKTSLATPQGEFRIQSKHIAAAMDSEENSSVSGGTKSARKTKLSPDAQATRSRILAADKAGNKLKGDDLLRLKNIRRGRHPEYGVTMRRGTGNYELRDVPWIQYFAAGYALHGAYWHDVFGVPRSHGCINLAPVDARIVFNWTEPRVPEGWHGINVTSDGQSTVVRIRE